MKKMLSLLLAVAMILSIVPTAVFAASISYDETVDDYYNVISKDDYELAPGIVESEIVLNNDAGSHRQVAHVVEIDINNPYTKVMPSSKGMHQGLDSKNYGVQIMSEQAAWAEANGYGNVVAAMNLSLSWYNSAYYSEHPELYGEPLGYLVMDGVYYENSQGKTSGAQTCLVINFDEKDGVARPSNIPKTEIRSTSSAITGWEEQVIPANFGFLVKDGVNQYKPDHTTDAASRSFVGIKADGSIIMVMNDGRQSPYSAGFNSYEMAQFMISLGCVQAVNGDGGGSSTFLSQRPGEELKLNCSPSDGAERPTTHGILVISTAPATGEFVRAQITTGDKFYTPGTAVQFNALGTDLVGTPADIPADAVWQLTDSSFGTIDNNGLFTSNGKTGDVTAQMVYNGEIVGEASIEIVVPKISFKQDKLVLPYGEASPLSLNVTTNNGLNTVATKPGDIVFTLSDAAMGTIEGTIFHTTSDTTVTGGMLTAVICGDTANAITATVKFGKASQIVYDYEDGQFLIDEDPEVDPAEGEPYGWFIRDTRANGHFAYRFFAKKNYTPVGYDIPAEVYLVNRDNGKVKNGNYAMGVDIDWTYVTASCHGQMDVFLPESLDLTDATRVGLWMYIPAELVTASMQLRAGFRTKSGSSTAVTANITDMMGTNSGVENGGWFYFSWEVLDTYKSFEYVQINSHYTAGEGNYNYYQKVTYYIDDITVDYSDATIDRENPYFTSLGAGEYDESVELNGQTITTNTIALKAQAYENTTKLNASGLDYDSVKLYVDGVLSTADITISAGGIIAVPELYLNDGVHTIVMEISDLQGNTGNIVRKVTVNTEKSAVRLEVPAPTVNLLPTGSIYWVNLVADNLAAIDSVTTTINLDYVNSWELEGMEVAYGFTAEYYVNNHNDAVITFTRTGNEVADTTVLAKLPIRIWMAKGWMDDSGIRKDYISNDPAKQDKYHILTPHAMWYSDGTRDYRLVVSAEAGAVTYVDGSTMTFSANETVIQTEMNRYYTNANKQGKWSFHICTAGEATDKAATCTESGYTGRVFCVGCACGSVENLNAECDTHNGCASVIEWGTYVPATGHSFDEEVDGIHSCADCGNVYYYVDGEAQIGWAEIDGKVYYFGLDGSAVNGEATVEGVTYTFADYILTAPALVSDGIGLIGWWAGKQMTAGWNTINGNRYYVNGIYVYTGINKIGLGTNIGMRYHIFDENGVFQSDFTGVIEIDGKLSFAQNGACAVRGLRKDNEGNYYYINRNYLVITNTYYTLNEELSNGLVPNGSYYFGADGKMVMSKNGLSLDDDGYIRYYKADVPVYAGLVQDADGNYYYINSSLKAVCNTNYYVSKTNDLLPAGEYTFGADGKMIMTKTGLYFDEDGHIRYYINDVAQYAGLVQDAEGNYYYINSSRKAIRGTTYYVTKTNGLLPEGEYVFGSDGKMIIAKNGIVKDEDGHIRYYIDDVAQYAGLVQDSDGSYYYINSSRKAVCGTSYYVTKTNGLLPEGEYHFGPDGKMIVAKNGLVKDADGHIRYYIDNVAQYAGLVQDADGNYYYINSSRKAVSGTSYYVTKTNGLLPVGEYMFDSEGKMIETNA